jgi:hypothetical protein
MAKKVTKKASKKSTAVTYPSSGGAYWSYFLVGMGAGILLTNPFVNPHPLRWGAALVLLGVAVFFVIKPKD